MRTPAFLPPERAEASSKRGFAAGAPMTTELREVLRCRTVFAWRTHGGNPLDRARCRASLGEATTEHNCLASSPALPCAAFARRRKPTDAACCVGSSRSAGTAFGIRHCWPRRGLQLWCLTFELSGRRRQDARPGLAKMCRVPPDRAWWPAVGAPLERGVRPHSRRKRPGEPFAEPRGRHLGGLQLWRLAIRHSRLGKAPRYGRSRSVGDRSSHAHTRSGRLRRECIPRMRSVRTACRCS